MFHRNYLTDGPDPTLWTSPPGHVQEPWVGEYDSVLRAGFV